MKKTKVKKELIGVNFDFEGAHVAYTDGAGAASLLNEPYLLKQKTKEIIEMDEKKKKEDEIKDDGVIKQLQITVDELQKKIKEYEKELTNIEVSKALKKYEFSEDIEIEICNVLSDIDTKHITTIQKCFDFLLEKTVVEGIEEIEKEIGYDKATDDVVDAEQPVKDSFVDMIIKAQEKYNTKK